MRCRICDRYRYPPLIYLDAPMLWTGERNGWGIIRFQINGLPDLFINLAAAALLARFHSSLSIYAYRHTYLVEQKAKTTTFCY